MPSPSMHATHICTTSPFVEVLSALRWQSMITWAVFVLVSAVHVHRRNMHTWKYVLRPNKAEHGEVQPVVYNAKALPCIALHCMHGL